MAKKPTKKVVDKKPTKKVEKPDVRVSVSNLLSGSACNSDKLNAVSAVVSGDKSEYADNVRAILKTGLKKTRRIELITSL